MTPTKKVEHTVEEQLAHVISHLRSWLLSSLRAGDAVSKQDITLKIDQLKSACQLHGQVIEVDPLIRWVESEGLGVTCRKGTENRNGGSVWYSDPIHIHSYNWSKSAAKSLLFLEKEFKRIERRFNRTWSNLEEMSPSEQKAILKKLRHKL
ncbi:hypothetical protein GCE9029_00068 [Grimontia celer]|uniref:Uncharacterized protein n=1 Tax=Grimontia celer TaxID=1796497 RepID=A0A128ERL8_9GAMM|nr:hypothetical protein [Grimontia celer]CZF77202.1 hypothetical protein GCE9029_00068 [Grimontia celer]